MNTWGKHKRKSKAGFFPSDNLLIRSMAKQQTIRFYNFILNLNEMSEFSFKRITVIKWHENKETLGQMEHGEYHRGICYRQKNWYWGKNHKRFKATDTHTFKFKFPCFFLQLTIKQQESLDKTYAWTSHRLVTGNIYSSTSWKPQFASKGQVILHVAMSR